MALVVCRECKNQCSSKAKSCPHCGVPRRQGGLAKTVLGLGMVFVVGSCVAGSVNRAANESRVQNATIRASVTPATPIPTPATKAAPPAPPKMPSRSAILAAIEPSDDFDEYRDEFLAATETLIRNGSCTLEGIRYDGGWVRSQTHKPRPVYFTYCGGSHVSNRVYLDVSTGEIFR